MISLVLIGVWALDEAQLKNFTTYGALLPIVIGLVVFKFAVSAMVRSIRRIEEALGSSQKKPSMSELQNRLVARRSIVALTSIKAGDLFSPQNVCAKRPGGGISPMRWDEVVGRVASRDYLPDEQIAL